MYIQRGRKRERERDAYTYIYTYIHIQYTYMANVWTSPDPWATGSLYHQDRRRPALSLIGCVGVGPPFIHKSLELIIHDIAYIQLYTYIYYIHIYMDTVYIYIYIYIFAHRYETGMSLHIVAFDQQDFIRFHKMFQDLLHHSTNHHE